MACQSFCGLTCFRNKLLAKQFVGNNFIELIVSDFEVEPDVDTRHVVSSLILKRLGFEAFLYNLVLFRSATLSHLLS